MTIYISFNKPITNKHTGASNKQSRNKVKGIREGDFLVEINGKKVYNYKLGEIIEKFYEKNNKKVKLLIDRNGERLKFEFRLRKIL